MSPYEIYFSSEPWLEMMDDFQGASHFPGEKYNISWIRKNANLMRLTAHEIPILIAVVVKVVVNQSNKKLKRVELTLADPTGFIKAMLHPEAYESLKEDVRMGTVLVIKHFSLLCGKELLLTIDRNKIIALYAKKKIDGTSEDFTTQFNLKRSRIELRSQSQPNFTDEQRSFRPTQYNLHNVNPEEDDEDNIVGPSVTYRSMERFFGNNERLNRIAEDYNFIHTENSFKNIGVRFGNKSLHAENLNNNIFEDADNIDYEINDLIPRPNQNSNFIHITSSQTYETEKLNRDIQTMFKSITKETCPASQFTLSANDPESSQILQEAFEEVDISVLLDDDF